MREGGKKAGKGNDAGIREGRKKHMCKDCCLPITAEVEFIVTWDG